MVSPELKTALGVVIRTERSALGISQEQLAERAGLHRTYVSDVERGARNPSIASVEKLAQALRLPIGALFDLYAPVLCALSPPHSAGFKSAKNGRP